MSRFYYNIDSVAEKLLGNSNEIPVFPENKIVEISYEGKTFNVLFNAQQVFNVRNMFGTHYDAVDAAQKQLAAIEDNRGRYDSDTGDSIEYEARRNIPDDSKKLSPEQMENRYKFLDYISSKCIDEKYLAKIVQLADKKKNGSLHKNRVVHIATASAVNLLLGIYELVAINISDYEMEIITRNGRFDCESFEQKKMNDLLSLGFFEFIPKEAYGDEADSLPFIAKIGTDPNTTFTSVKIKYGKTSCMIPVEETAEGLKLNGHLLTDYKFLVKKSNGYEVNCQYLADYKATTREKFTLTIGMKQTDMFLQYMWDSIVKDGLLKPSAYELREKITKWAFKELPYVDLKTVEANYKKLGKFELYPMEEAVDNFLSIIQKMISLIDDEEVMDKLHSEVARKKDGYLSKGKILHGLIWFEDYFPNFDANAFDKFQRQFHIEQIEIKARNMSENEISLELDGNNYYGFPEIDMTVIDDALEGIKCELAVYGVDEWYSKWMKYLVTIHGGIIISKSYNTPDLAITGRPEDIEWDYRKFIEKIESGEMKVISDKEFIEIINSDNRNSLRDSLMSTWRELGIDINKYASSRTDPKAKEWLDNYGKYLVRDPEIVFNKSRFVLSGVAESSLDEEEIIKKITDKGGLLRPYVFGLIDYLVVEPSYAGSEKTDAVIEGWISGGYTKIIHIDDLLKALGLAQQ